MEILISITGAGGLIQITNCIRVESGVTSSLPYTKLVKRATLKILQLEVKRGGANVNSGGGIVLPSTLLIQTL